jgi:hypothetical protein
MICVQVYNFMTMKFVCLLRKSYFGPLFSWIEGNLYNESAWNHVRFCIWMNFIRANERMSEEDYCRIACNAITFGEIHMFRRSISAPSSGSKSKQSKKQVEASGRVSESRTARVTCSSRELHWLIALLTLQPWRWERYVPSKGGYLIELHVVTSQKTARTL